MWNIWEGIKKPRENGNVGINPEVSLLSNPRKQNTYIQFGLYVAKIMHSPTTALTEVVIRKILVKLS